MCRPPSMRHPCRVTAELPSVAILPRLLEQTVRKITICSKAYEKQKVFPHDISLHHFSMLALLISSSIKILIKYIFF